MYLQDRERGICIETRAPLLHFRLHFNPYSIRDLQIFSEWEIGSTCFMASPLLSFQEEAWEKLHCGVDAVNLTILVFDKCRALKPENSPNLFVCVLQAVCRGFPFS
ncbi:hypothetical protein M404DRAFT_1005633 [Pisolithus tinctorius Marx 270]|uniref:Uncharacterized protein n=1 Tax=Pisolithus tinctorius Marx 270 TaxID=870435 RepID=A0A0C3NRF8_PISTI|nr:hypothetical protein M404DRAFT_1005633 [Pisolithus tinctorius Marx 270]